MAKMNTMQQGATKPRRWRTCVVKTIAFAACAVVVVEAALHVLHAVPEVVYEENPEVGFRLKPNQDTRFFGNRIRINRWGLRDPRPLDNKPDGVRRVLVLGDSVTWGGIQAQQEDLFTTRLEKALDNVEVVNAGVNGYSVAQMTALYRTRLEGLDPDLVVLFVIPGDFTRAPSTRLIRDSVAYPLSKPRFQLPTALAMVPLTVFKLTGWGWLEPKPDAVPARDWTDEEAVRANIDAAVSLATDLGCERVTVVVSPWLASPVNPPLPEEVAAAFNTAGVRWIDLNAVTRPEPDWFIDHIHLSPKGHAAVADTLAKHLPRRGTSE